ncbi:MAG: HAMP domain-containing sensor histidine kinase [Verrucomicrobiales bacterium]|nr:HAMP domain-containing sensor histidine kinase [Verrucomicrobiales bacterium]
MATVFVIAVLVPTLVLAWLAMRSLRDQEIVANSQRAILHQSSTEALAADLNTFMDDVRIFYRQLVDDLVTENGAAKLSVNFDEIVPDRWAQSSVACVVTDDGEILSPSPDTTDPKAQEFLKFNAQFLLNQSDVKVYEAPPVNQIGPVISTNRINTERESGEILKKSDERITGYVTTEPTPRLGLPRPEAMPQAASSPSLSRNAQPAPAMAPAKDENIQYKVEVAKQKMRSYNPYRRMNQNEPLEDEAKESVSVKASESEVYLDALANPPLRKVQPSQSVFGSQGMVQQNSNNDNLSRLEWGIGNLKEITEGKTEGAMSRFIHDGLHVMLWNRHPGVEDRIFWVELNLEEIKNDLKKVVTGYSAKSDICLALLDADGKMVAKSDDQFTTDWSKPFVASEVGQILPFWEVGAYLIDPEMINHSARTAKLMIWLLVPTLLTAIGIGTFLIFRSIGTEMQLARQKTDFVSNVSHELKTPLTSIRMFSDLLNEEAMSEKDRQYSGIISREAARLSRLINNLLDFSRLERTDNPYSKAPLDLSELTRETVETYRMQIEADGCHLVYDQKPEGSVTVTGDRDALAQVLLNLLSNAEKYGCEKGEIEVRLLVDESRQIAKWQVLDRGEGIDRKHSARIFEKFYRIDDFLSSGVQGSGLGLALARQIVLHHRGEISYQNRKGGGCCFTVELPISDERQSPENNQSCDS